MFAVGRNTANLTFRPNERETDQKKSGGRADQPVRSLHVLVRGCGGGFDFFLITISEGLLLYMSQLSLSNRLRNTWDRLAVHQTARLGLI